MTHLEFVDKLNNLGISIRSTNTEHGTKTYNVSYGLRSTPVEVKGFEVKYTEVRDFDAFEALIKDSIDMDSWKNSWHIDVDKTENYGKFQEIIQEKIIDRAKQIDMLLTTYFLIAKRISDQTQLDNER